jgi:carbonic anhydrase
MDFRLEPSIAEYMKANGLNSDTDVISVAGAAKDINDDSFGGVVKSQLALSSKLHSINTIILMNHTDCGGYGGRAAFDNDIEKEHAAHVEELGKAAASLKEIYPDITVKQVLANIDDEGKVNIEEIA